MTPYLADVARAGTPKLGEGVTRIEERKDDIEIIADAGGSVVAGKTGGARGRIEDGPGMRRGERGSGAGARGRVEGSSGRGRGGYVSAGRSGGGRKEPSSGGNERKSGGGRRVDKGVVEDAADPGDSADRGEERGEALGSGHHLGEPIRNLVQSGPVGVRVGEGFLNDRKETAPNGARGNVARGAGLTDLLQVREDVLPRNELSRAIEGDLEHGGEGWREFQDDGAQGVAEEILGVRGRVGGFGAGAGGVGGAALQEAGRNLSRASGGGASIGEEAQCLRVESVRISISVAQKVESDILIGEALHDAGVAGTDHARVFVQENEDINKTIQPG